jgi:hypothetical protein
MATTPSASAGGDSATQLTVDLGQTELTDDELHSLQNDITRLAVDHVQKSAAAAAPDRRKGEPFVKIIFVKAIHPR